MTTRERVHQLVDEAPDATLEAVAALLERWRDPVLRAFDTAPEGEPETPEEAAAVAEARAETEPPIPLEEIRREFGL